MTQPVANPIVSHTRGPWTPVDRVIETDSPDRPGFDLVVAWISDDVDEATSRANARLIAAAPELLATLKNVLAHLRSITLDPGDDEEDAPALVAAEALVAKAEGREP